MEIFPRVLTKFQYRDTIMIQLLEETLGVIIKSDSRKKHRQ